MCVNVRSFIIKPPNFIIWQYVHDNCMILMGTPKAIYRDIDPTTTVFFLCHLLPSIKGSCDTSGRVLSLPADPSGRIQFCPTRKWINVAFCLHMAEAEKPHARWTYCQRLCRRTTGLQLFRSAVHVCEAASLSAAAGRHFSQRSHSSSAVIAKTRQSWDTHSLSARVTTGMNNRAVRFELDLGCVRLQFPGKGRKKRQTQCGH